jgi:NAD(P)-dependent dehydrogenase (short-subunit alcohol dehydrogenase family)
MINFNFSGKRALVIGGSRGIGGGVVKNLVELGADTFYAARNPGIKVEKAKFIKVDLNNENEIIDLFNVIDQDGAIDIVVNTAAINFCKKFDEISAVEWDLVERVNLRAAFIVCQQASIIMKKQKYGRIVNVSSIAGRHRSLVSGIHYVSTKAGLIGLTRQLAYELGQYNVNVNVVCPSQTMSDMLSESMSNNEIAALAENIPLRRIATINEQVGPILFLCSDLSAYMTGAVIDVNGGQI